MTKPCVGPLKCPVLPVAQGWKILEASAKLFRGRKVLAPISALVSLPRGGIPKAAFAERVAADTAREKARGVLDCAGYPDGYRWRCRPDLPA
jgi:hypothetical protein